MNVQCLDQSPRNRRGGQVSYLLLAPGQFAAENMSITWVEGEPGSEQPNHSHPNNEQVYVIVHGRGEMTVGDETRKLGREPRYWSRPRQGTPFAISAKNG